MAKLEEKGKVTPAQTEKLERNETKLTETHKEYEETATKTSHLLEEASRHGWKDLHPLLKAMMTAEWKRESDLHAVWGLTSTIQDKVAHVVDKHDVPLPASAFSTEIVLVSRRSGDADLDVSDEEEE